MTFLLYDDLLFLPAITNCLSHHAMIFFVVLQENLHKSYRRHFSHELHTPLNTVYLGLKVLIDDINMGNKRKCLDTVRDIFSSVEVSLGILNSILLSDRIQCDMLHLDLKWISPSTFFAL